MHRLAVAALLAAAAVLTVHAAVQGDYVDGRTLPGWLQPLPSCVPALCMLSAACC